MTLKIRTTLVAGAVAALIAGPSWAASHSAKDGAYTPPPTKAESGQPTAAQPTGETPPRMGAADHGTTVRPPIDDNPLYARSADDLNGAEVVDRSGEKVGDVKRLVLAPDRMSALAVISVDGDPGMGARDMMISLDDLTPIDDKLEISATKEETMELNDETPDADKYVELTGGSPISASIVEFSSVEQDKEASTPGAASMTPEVDADKPTHPAITPNSDTDKPATDPETPRAPQ